jgi:hypothetical protein
MQGLSGYLLALLKKELPMRPLLPTEILVDLYTAHNRKAAVLFAIHQIESGSSMYRALATNGDEMAETLKAQLANDLREVDRLEEAYHAEVFGRLLEACDAS